MSQEIGIYTETMAKVFTAQGHWENAAAVYRRLLSGDPERRDWAEALADVEKNIKRISRRDPEELVPIFHEWIELLFRREKLRKLKGLKGKNRG